MLFPFFIPYMCTPINKVVCRSLANISSKVIISVQKLQADIRLHYVTKANWIPYQTFKFMLFCCIKYHIKHISVFLSLFLPYWTPKQPQPFLPYWTSYQNKEYQYSCLVPCWILYQTQLYSCHIENYIRVLYLSFQFVSALFHAENKI